MRDSFTKSHSARASRAKQEGKARIGIVAAVALFVVLGCVGFQFYRSANVPAPVGANPEPALSSATSAVLSGLKSPVEIRFYSLLDPASTPDSLRAYAKRVDELLAEYELAGKGNVRVVRFDSLSEANADAAAKDGIHVFNREKGEECYLGIAIVSGDQKQSIAELSPDWEQALESDLSRAVAGVSETKTAAPSPASISSSDMMAAEKVIQSNPALASANLEEGSQILRDAALAELKAAVAEMQQRTQQAEQSLNNGSSSADVARQIDQIHAEGTAKMQEIAARLHNELEALQQSRKAGR